jgi:hypothetical protein
MEKPSNESLAGAGLVFAAERAGATSCASPEFAVSSASSRPSRLSMSWRAGSSGPSVSSFERSSRSVLRMVAPVRSARQEMKALATAFAIPTARPASELSAENVRMSLSDPPVTFVAADSSEGRPSE